MSYRQLDKGLAIGIVMLCIAVAFPVVPISALDYPQSCLFTQQNKYPDVFFNQVLFLCMKLGHIPSLSACIIKNNEPVWASGYGYSDIEHKKTANVNTIYGVASISKVITATALMQLYDEGLFGLDDDINEYLNFSIRNPYYPDDPITFRMLLAHHSSLAEEPWYHHTLYPGDCPIPLYPFLKEYLVLGGSEYFPEIWVNCRPGKEFHYANTGYWVIGYLVEVLSNQPFDQYCKEHIFLPLNMMNTSFRFADIPKENLAVPYIYGFWGYEPFMHAGSVGYPSDGLRTTVMDLSCFLIVHLNDGVYNGVRLLKEETVRLMQNPQYSSDSNYGLGWEIWKNRRGGSFFGYGGGNIGISSNMIVRCSDNVSVMFFVNRKVTLYRELIAEQLIEQLLFIQSIKFSEVI